ncbi:DcaP family trimeric outer membrane transporter [Moraxella sp. ZY210820]|uniref:DcaP family trimeric outer membrane transporter n=1 Tax=unclassified Moraxella TaxID=2685852 RepID=UPI00273229FC|nr:DcaP family trimeric outer membrane transporter [Moraxella sp. ZY210820]WLF84641.1 DcaP family trimeric outer membrane transporter [Moraxella sp. ZY210820]
MKLTSHKLAKTSLAVALLGLLTGTAHALTPEQKELQQLRAELNALKATVQAQQAPVSVVSAPVAKSGSALSLQTKNGAEAKIYGFVRADAYYKIKGNDATSWQVWNDIANAPRGNNDKKLNTTVATTRLGLDFATPVAGDKKVGGKIEADFIGGGNINGANLRIRHAYLTYGNWLIGQTWSTFNDLNFLPSIIDFNLAAGQGAQRHQMVRYETNIAPTTKVAVAVEKSTASDRTPNLVGRVQQKFAGDAGLISARAFVGEAKRENEKEVAWGAAAGVSYKVSNDLKLMADYNHIKGNTQYIATGINPAIAGFDANGDLVLNEFDSVSVAANYNINPKLAGAVGLGYMKAKDKGIATANETITQGFANVVYKPVPAVGFGLEYIHGETEQFNGTKGQDQRVGVNATYSF